MEITQDDINFFTGLLDQRCFSELNQRKEYSSDHTEDIESIPGVVLKPKSTTEVSAILKHCNERKLPVTPIGAQTGLSGGAIPEQGGIALSMELLNTIIEIDKKNSQVTVEPGVITQVLQEAVKEKGLFYPPDPASKGSCFIGGNIAENSGGPKAVKYGVTSDYVLNLEVVLADGTIIWTGANVLKNATGYNLTQLIVGSEGTLGVVTKIVLRLIPHPSNNLLILVPFSDSLDACKAVSLIFQEGITPSGLEFMERDALLLAQNFIEDTSIPVLDNHAAHLLIEVDGMDVNTLMDECTKITDILEQFEVGDILFAESEAQKDKLWRLRRSVGEAVKAKSTYKEEDTVVPRYQLPALLKKVKELGKSYGFESVCYGHAGDGNLHINILKGDLSDQFWNTELSKAIRELFEEVKQLGGTLSGEHGIGLVQKQYMDIVFPEVTMDLMRGIKRTFDPNNILNPNKIF